MLTRIALAVVISSLVAGPAFAQTGTTTGTGTVTGGTTTGTTTGGSTIGTGAPVTGGAFASLSPGNRKIAQALFVTVPTVEGHLTNVFGKLAVRRRAQLPAALAAPTQAVRA